jgi:hypothetical protein
MILPQVGSRTAGKRENQTKVRFALRKIPINGWKVKVRGLKGVEPASRFTPPRATDCWLNKKEFRECR